ncbi:MAG TPA: D-alanyl-D-alanine carboxypeptidase [Candidatus Scatomonas pullistercoris]|uniref:serine-type D-Ala-D-Ala carboxypeptidase n=1 Tax=Candidatus Scatomonas pullistercoris TaxID=2840920 RepID=A0A9D1P145_9FIRM|nr:D-alanyl-D-alanine carboxypeptidase [Candidatus Scatomonas pullistercoris]
MKKVLALLLGLLLFLGSPLHVPGEENQFEDELYAASACLLDADSGRVLYGKAEEEALAMASTTKIMTCILALENTADPAGTVLTASREAASQPEVRLGVHAGQQFSMQDLLYALMLESYNDTAVMIAEGTAGSVEAFAELMNRKAEEIGCRDTHFVTPNGLDGSDAGGEHHTTAADLALMLRYCIRQSPKAEQFLEITGTSSYSFWDRELKNVYDCVNHNALLSMMEGTLSGKTGFTSKAGYCYVGAVQQGDRCLIVSLLACGWPDHRDYKWSDARKLLEYGFENYEYRDVFDRNFRGREIPVADGRYGDFPGEGSAFTTAEFGIPEEERSLRLLLRADEQVEIRYDLPETLEAPVSAGEEIGNVRYSLKGEELAVYPLYASSGVEKKDYFWCLRQLWKWYCGRQ